MNKIRLTLIACCLFFMNLTMVLAQKENDLDALLADPTAEHSKEFVSYTFKSTRIINAHSVEQTPAGVMDMRILHRFGSISGGAYQLFGLDQASMRMSLDYGITPWMQVGIGRSTTGKELDGVLKLRLLRQVAQGSGSPITLTYAVGSTLSTLSWPEPERGNFFSSRMAYYHQILMGKKLNETLSLQLTPSLVHRNLVATRSEPNDIFALGVGGRIKTNARMALTFDYFLVPGKQLVDHNNSLSLGVDIETGGHVFQLHISNSRGLNERQFISGTNGRWDQGDLFFGFNLSRVFTLRAPKMPEPDGGW
jgi:hypothetical protein